MNPYTVHPYGDVIRDPEFPGDRAESGIVWWEVWRDMQRTSYGWTGDFVDHFDTEAEALSVARALNHELRKAEGQ